MKRIACVGDSITWGFTLLNPVRDSYPSLLQKMAGNDFRVFNFGVNNAAVRYDSDCPYVGTRKYQKSLSCEPDLVILMLGSNDTKHRNWNPDIFRKDYMRLIDSYADLSSQPKIVLVAPIRIHRVIGIPLMGLYPEAMEEGVRPTIKAVSQELQLPMIDLEALFPDGGYCLDGVHPQRKGTEIMAKHIYDSLLSLNLL